MIVEGTDKCLSVHRSSVNFAAMGKTIGTQKLFGQLFYFLHPKIAVQ